DYTFIASENGQHTFTGGVTLVTAGNQMVTATDTQTASITGSAVISVTPTAATHFAVGAPAAATAGSPFTITATALDQFGNRATGYTGTAHFSKSDTTTGSFVPADYPFAAADSGQHVFTN